jgi:type I restriction enzyme S subunit
VTSTPLKRIARLMTKTVGDGARSLVALEHLESGTGKLLPDARLIDVPPGPGVTTVAAGDVLFGKLRPYLAKSWVADRPTFASTELLCLRPQRETYSRWLGYVVASSPVIEWAVATSDGTKMPRTSWEKLGEFRLVVPSPNSQRVIAEYLDRETARIDALVVAKRRMVTLLEERRAEAVGRLVLGFASRDPSMPVQDWASALLSRWSTTTLGRCLTRATYGFTNPMPTVDDGPYLLTANDIGDGVIKYSTARRTSEEAYSTAITDKCRPRVGDVLVTKDGSLGRVARADGARACINQSVALLRPSPALDSNYLVAVLRSFPYQQLMAFQAGGTTIKHIYVTRIIKMPIPIPSIEDQRLMTARVHTIDERHNTATNNLKRSILLLQERRQALITAAVTGQIDILSAS